MYELKFNYDLGIFPISLFKKIPDELLDVFGEWDAIINYKCNDVIFYGNIIENINRLNFLNSRLISERIHTSVIVSDIGDGRIIESVIASRFIVLFESNVHNSTHFMKRMVLLTQLSTNDIVILSPSSLKEFLFTVQKLTESKVKAKIMLESANGKVSPQDLIDNGVHNVYLYYGDKLDVYS